MVVTKISKRSIAVSLAAFFSLICPWLSSPSFAADQTTLVAVNGTLMRGLALEKNMHNAKATFVREDNTKAIYRMWSIDDNYPAMQRVSSNGVSLALEVWRIPKSGLVNLLLQEPPGLTLGKVVLEDDTVVLGVLGENIITENKTEISKWGGWRQYMNSVGVASSK